MGEEISRRLTWTTCDKATATSIGWSETCRLDINTTTIAAKVAATAITGHQCIGCLPRAATTG